MLDDLVFFPVLIFWMQTSRYCIGLDIFVKNIVFKNTAAGEGVGRFSYTRSKQDV